MNYSTNNLAEQLLIEENKNTYLLDYKLLNETIKSKGGNAIEIIY